MSTQKGKVYLVGAGPGDPGLITVKGQACIAKADTVIYDYLADPSLLQHIRPEAERIYVGKKGGDHTLSQDGINTLICEKAKTGKIVTRLKGGDPFIFGRGGEEAEVLVAEGIAFEIVPGVTSAIAAPAYAGIPLTHRSHTSTVAFVTGHEDPTKTDSQIDWRALAQGIGTVVFLMGVKNLPQIVANLLRHGRAADTPVALVRWGTKATQKTVVGTLSDIVERCTQAALRPPAVIVVGSVVGLREKLRWFEKRPLLGKRIVVTRARRQASALVDRLSDLGADCLQIPTIEIVPTKDWRKLDAAIDDIAHYQWLVLTSVNGVDCFFKRLLAKGRDARDLHGLHTAAIGPATSARLRHYGLNTDIVPETYRAESVVAAFADRKMAGQRVLLPRATGARPVLPEELTRMGAQVDEIEVYTAHLVAEHADQLIAELEANRIDMVTFTSSSTVRNFLAQLPRERIDALMSSAAVASIGPITTETAIGMGLKVNMTADEYTIDGLVDAVCTHYGVQESTDQSEPDQG